jgi:flagellar biosynthetic protein FliQ
MSCIKWIASALAVERSLPRRSLRTRGGDTQGWVLAMTVDQSTEMIRHAFVVVLILSAPILIVGLIVTLIVSLLQAVTQVQEQTLSFIPKIVAMVLATMLLVPWLTQHLLDYAKQLFAGGIH